MNISYIAPAKLILSGEYSVCYGYPAIGVPLPLYLKTTWLKNILKYNDKDVFTINNKSYSYEQIKSIAQNILSNEAEDKLVIFTIYSLMQKFDFDLSGISLTIESDIPLSYGLGSSSAVIYSIASSLNNHYKWNLNKQDLINYSKKIEHFQHGNSSGFDLSIIAFKKPIFFQSNPSTNPPICEILDITIPKISIVFSGRSKNSTLECANHVKSLNLKEDFWKEYSIVTLEMKKSLMKFSSQSFINAIKKQHRLMMMLEVVPKLVSGFIKECEKIGGAAKISGAGAISDDNAGAIMVYFMDNQWQDFEILCKKYNYEFRYFTFERS